MKAAITIRLDDDLGELLDRLSEETGRTRSDIVRDALRRQLSLLRFEQLRRKTVGSQHLGTPLSQEHSPPGSRLA